MIFSSSDGNALLDEAEHERGGWLLLTLDYIYEVFLRNVFLISIYLLFSSAEYY
jgi:hypothetical protein